MGGCEAWGEWTAAPVWGGEARGVPLSEILCPRIMPSLTIKWHFSQLRTRLVSSHLCLLPARGEPSLAGDELAASAPIWLDSPSRKLTAPSQPPSPPIESRSYRPSPSTLPGMAGIDDGEPAVVLPRRRASCRRCRSPPDALRPPWLRLAALSLPVPLTCATVASRRRNRVGKPPGKRNPRPHCSCACCVTHGWDHWAHVSV